MSKIIGYIRVSTEKQDLKNQKFTILDYAQKNNLKINKFIEVEASSRKNESLRKIDILKNILGEGDSLVVTELSRLGRNMIEVLNIINHLTEELKVKVIFIRQPELSTSGQQGQLLCAIYGHLAQMERDFISERTKAGLAARKAKGQILGRPKGTANKQMKLDEYKEKIRSYLDKKVSVSSIAKIINSELEKDISYPTYANYIKNMKKQIVEEKRVAKLYNKAKKD